MPFKNPHPLYQIWQGMKARCLNPNNPHYANYGGRGIKICDEWINNFNQFVADMKDRPCGYSIDRIDNNGNYERFGRTVVLGATHQDVKAEDLIKNKQISFSAIIQQAKKNLKFI